MHGSKKDQEKCNRACKNMYFIIKTLRIKTNERFLKKSLPEWTLRLGYMSAVLPIARDRHLRRNTQIVNLERALWDTLNRRILLHSCSYHAKSGCGSNPTNTHDKSFSWTKKLFSINYRNIAGADHLLARAKALSRTTEIFPSILIPFPWIWRWEKFPLNFQEGCIVI